MDEGKVLLRHFLAALAYRTQKALRGSSESFASFRAAREVRTPLELVHHMNSVLGYARTFFHGGTYRPEPLPDLEAEMRRLHATLADLARDIEEEGEWTSITPAQLLHGNDPRRGRVRLQFRSHLDELGSGGRTALTHSPGYTQVQSDHGRTG